MSHIKRGTVVLQAYRVSRVLDVGPMGEMFEGEDGESGQQNVVISVLRADSAGDITAYARYQMEVELVRGLRHPGVAHVLAVGQHDDGRLVRVRQSVPGETLARRLEREGRLAAEQVAVLVEQLAAALDAVHGHNVAHRDLRPEAIIVADQAGEVTATILDFGVARLVHADVTRSRDAMGLLGSLNYLPPELATGGSLEAAHKAGDIYALACIAYHGLAGTPPFVADDPATLLGRIINEPPPPLAGVIEGVGAHTDAVLAQAMAKQPAQRYPRAVALADALRDALLQDANLSAAERARPESPLDLPGIEETGPRFDTKPRATVPNQSPLLDLPAPSDVYRSRSDQPQLPPLSNGPMHRRCSPPDLADQRSPSPISEELPPSPVEQRPPWASSDPRLDGPIAEQPATAFPPQRLHAPGPMADQPTAASHSEPPPRATPPLMPRATVALDGEETVSADDPPRHTAAYSQEQIRQYSRPPAADDRRPPGRPATPAKGAPLPAAAGDPYVQTDVVPLDVIAEAMDAAPAQGQAPEPVAPLHRSPMVTVDQMPPLGLDEPPPLPADLTSDDPPNARYRTTDRVSADVVTGEDAQAPEDPFGATTTLDMAAVIAAAGATPQPSPQGEQPSTTDAPDPVERRGQGKPR